MSKGGGEEERNILITGIYKFHGYVIYFYNRFTDSLMMGKFTEFGKYCRRRK